MTLIQIIDEYACIVVLSGRTAAYDWLCTVTDQNLWYNIVRTVNDQGKFIDLYGNPYGAAIRLLPESDDLSMTDERYDLLISEAKNHLSQMKANHNSNQRDQEELIRFWENKKKNDH